MDGAPPRAAPPPPASPGRIEADVELRGSDTLITGRAAAGPAALTLRDLRGRVGPGFLPLVPGLPVESCTSRAVVDVARLRLDRRTAAADGVISIDVGRCVDRLGRDHLLPAMRVDLLSQDGDAVAIVSDDGGRLGRLTLTGDRRVLVRVEPEGAVLVPGLPTSGPIIVEYPL